DAASRPWKRRRRSGPLLHHLGDGMLLCKMSVQPTSAKGAPMALTPTPVCNFGWKAPDFALKGVDGKIHTLSGVRGPKGTLVIFICNHCPYVRAIAGRLSEEARALQKLGIGVVAIMPNDTENYPEDSFDNMKRFAKEHDFAFPYVIDETQEVARA